MNLKTLEDVFKNRNDLQVTIGKGFWVDYPSDDIEICMIWKEKLDCGCLKDAMMHGYGRTITQALEDVLKRANLTKS